MNLLKILIPFSFLSFAWGCEGSTETDKIASNKTRKDTIAKTNNSLMIDSFNNVPEELAGCGCYFSETKKQFDDKQYIFAASYDSIAFISIDKQLIKLKLSSTTRKPETFGDTDHVDIYMNATFKVTVDIKYKDSSGEEVWWNDGTITIERKDGSKLTKKFVGECGC